MRFKKFLKYFNNITKNTINDIKKNCNKILNKKNTKYKRVKYKRVK